MKKSTHRGPVFRIVHRSGRVSRVRGGEFLDNLRAGNLLQTQAQKQSDRFLAFVHPGLVAIVNDANRLTFEFERRITRQEICRQLVTQFEYPTGDAHRIAHAIMLAREFMKIRWPGVSVWMRFYVSHMLNAGFASRKEIAHRIERGLPRFEAEPVIEYDLESGKVLYEEPAFVLH